MSAPRFANTRDVASYEGVPLDSRLADQDLFGLFRQHAEEAPDATAIVYVPDGVTVGDARSFSRGQLLDAVQTIAHDLAVAGIVATDIVASLLPNGPGTIAAALATMSVGCLAPINIYLEISQIEALLRTSGAKFLLVPRDAPAAIAAVVSSLRDRRHDDGPVTLTVDTSGLPESDRATARRAARAPGQHVALFPTGGTTGLPKFVPLTARNIAAGAVVSQFAYGYAPAESILCAMPMFHVGGLFACSLYPLAVGSEVVILGPLGYRGEGVVAALSSTIEKLDVSVVVGPPTIMAQLAARPPDRRWAQRLRLFVNGAAALPSVVGGRLSSATDVPVVEPWGLTECTLAVTSGPRDGHIRQGSVGLALPYSEVKAVRTDDAGRAIGDCAVNEIGTLAVRGPMVFTGYLGRSVGQQPFFDDGWLDSGDLGRIDEDGFVWVTGRAKELIKRGGHGIDPSMIENAISAHTAVALVAAIGRPDAYAGEIPIAYVELRPGQDISMDELIAFARERIPERAAVPKEIIFLPKLPVTPIGKVHKHTLKVDITLRSAIQCVQAVLPEGEPRVIAVEPHALHGILADIRVPARFVNAVREQLAALPFRSQVSSFQQEST